MDFLAQEIASRKASRQAPASSGDEPPNKRRKFMTKREKDELERELQREQEEKERAEREKTDPSSASASASSSSSGLSRSAEAALDAASGEKVLTRAREDVIRRLREAGRVVTYFGESDWDREQRFLQYEIDKEQSEEYQKGLKNELDTFRRQLEALEADEIEAFINQGKKKSKVTSKDLFPFPDEATLPLLSDKHDLVLFTFKRLLAMWEAEIRAHLQDEMSKKVGNPNYKREISKLKQEAATYKQTSSYLKPFFKSLRKRSTPKDILEHMLNIVTCMKEKEYLLAEDVYLQMSIGNSPWPIGVTMVGIHERSAREKISSNQIAHVLNDETQRKYIQSVKRLMSYCQKCFPTNPSKMMG